MTYWEYFAEFALRRKYKKKVFNHLAYWKTVKGYHYEIRLLEFSNNQLVIFDSRVGIRETLTFPTLRDSQYVS